MQFSAKKQLTALSSSFTPMRAGVSLALTLGLLLSGAAVHASALSDPGTRSAGPTGTGGLVPVVPEIDAGEVTIGSSSQVVVRFRNDSSKEIKVGQISLYPSSTVSASITLNECGKDVLPAGAECATVVSVKGLKTGNWRVEMLLRHDGKTKIVTAALEGTVDAGEDGADKLLSDVETIPDELDFGSLDSSRPIIKSVVLRNVTSDPIDISDVTIQASAQAGYSLSSDCSKLEVGQACIATVTWSPTAVGQAEGVLQVRHNGPTRVASVELKGKYDPKAVEKAKIFPDAVPGLGLLVSSAETVDFGSAVGNESSVTVSLVNVGDMDMTINDITVGDLDNGLSIANTGCKRGTVLAPIEACPLTINWTPAKTGSILDDVRVAHDGARGVLVIPVRGSATGVVNKDTKAVVVKEGGEPVKQINKGQALDGFVVTSHSNKKAIINGPGGSRVVTDGQTITLGGLQWTVSVTEAGIEFISGPDRVRLGFDRSLSSVNRTGAVSTSGSGSSSSSSSAATTTATTTPAAATN